MNLPGDCILQAGTVLVGQKPDGRMELRHDVAIRIHDGFIAHIGAPEAVIYGNEDIPVYGGPDMVAMPGLVNSHHHFGVTPLMGGVPFAPLEMWLPWFRTIPSVGARLDTLFSAIEMLESGVTTVHHIHSGLTGTPDDWMATTGEVLGAYADIGMRVGYSFMMRDRNVLGYDADADILGDMPPEVAAWWRPRLASAAVPVAAWMDFYRAARGRFQSDKTRINLAPANLHWLTDEALTAIFDTARETGANIHMHLCETERQAWFAQETYGCSAVRHLADLGALGPNVTLGHGNWLTREDMDIVAGCGCSICHNASSGLRLGSGIAPVAEMRARGIDVALGIDQSNIADDRDMLLEMKLAWALHRGTGLWSKGPSAGDVLRMATEAGARTVGFGGVVGRIAPGQQADVALLSRAALERPFVSPHTPIEETILHRATRGAVDSVFVAGRRVVAEGRVIGIDRDAVMAEVRDRLAAAPEAEIETARAMLAASRPALEARLQALPDGAKSYRFNRMAD